MWLIAAPWLAPIAIVAAIYTRLVGPFHEGLGGVFLIVVSMLFALLLNVVGVVVLIIRALLRRWRGRSRA